MSLSQSLWDLWCIASIIGIWPRFIEPKLLSVTHLNLHIPHLPADLSGIKILHFSDLHWNAAFSKSFQKKCTKKINALHPDIIVFTGDFICRSILENPQGLKDFLCSLKAKHGLYAILGNHDYAQFVTVNENGDFDVASPTGSPIKKGFKLLLSSNTLTEKITAAAAQVGPNTQLINLLKKTPFQLIDNTSILIPYKNSFVNLCGLGEYSVGNANIVKTFENYDARYPGIILTHNPDSIPLLRQSPGDLILAGHTHGLQINLPWIGKKVSMMKNFEWKRGLKKFGNKWIYINRGIGSVLPFRWFSIPELSLVTLSSK